jgi:hypothetical protein
VLPVQRNPGVGHVGPVEVVSDEHAIDVFRHAVCEHYLDGRETAIADNGLRETYSNRVMIATGGELSHRNISGFPWVGHNFVVVADPLDSVRMGAIDPIVALEVIVDNRCFDSAKNDTELG